MIYLMTQIAFILAVAAIVGLGVGWWVRGKAGEGNVSGSIKELPDNPFDARFRLEQCHRDNSALRRELKDAESRAEKLQARLESAETVDDGDMMEKLESAEIRVQALMEDLQMRDDTIEVLERELELLRSNS